MADFRGLHGAPPRPSHRFSLDDRRAFAVLASAVAGGLTTASPVGSTVLDIVWCALFAGGGAYLAATAKRGPLLAAATGVTVLGVEMGLAFGGAAIVAAAVATRHLNRRAPFSRGVAGGLAVASVLASSVQVSAGRIAALAALAAIGLVSGLSNMPTARRTRVLRAAAVLGAAVVLATGAAVGGVLLSRATVVEAQLALAEGLAAGRAGDVAAVTEATERVERLAESARNDVGRWGGPARLLPGGAQNVGAMLHVLEGVSRVAAEAGVVARTTDLDATRPRKGVIALDALEELQVPFRRVERALDELAQVIDDDLDGPLIGPVHDRLAGLASVVDPAADSAATAADLAEVMPDVLGAAAPRRYLVVFTSPAEVRGRFGFPSAYAEVTFDQGRFDLIEHGSVSQTFGTLDYDQSAFDFDAPELQPYLAFGVLRQFVNATIPADFPTTARTMATMWAQSGRVPVDGVLRVDPAALAGLMSFTGPVAVEGLDAPLDATTVEDYLLRGQYTQFPDAQTPRREVLDTVSEAVFERLETADLPGPSAIGTLFGPIVAEGRLSFELLDPDEAGAIDPTGLRGAFPARSGALMVTAVNSVGNKIDTFLRKEVRVDGRLQGSRYVETVAVTVHNDAPADGLPFYVIGSSTDPPLPSGTNRSSIFVYSGAEPTTVTVDGEAREVRAVREGDVWVTLVQVDVGPGGSTEIVVTGRRSTTPRILRLYASGGVTPDVFTVRAALAGGEASFDGPVAATVEVR